MLTKWVPELPLQRGLGLMVRPLVASWPLHPDRPHRSGQVPVAWEAR